MNPDLDTLATRLYVTIDDLLIDHPQWVPERPAVGITPKLTDAELLTLAVLQALLATRAKPASSATRTRIFAPGSRTCRIAPATTSGSVELAM